MKTETVYSTVEYRGKDAQNAPFWKNCHHEDEVTPEMFTDKKWFKYSVKFDGLRPVMITKMEEI